MSIHPFAFWIAVIVCTAALAQDARPGDEDAARKAAARSAFLEARTAYDAKDYARSIELYNKAIENGIKTAEAPYNLACCQALLGETDEAFKSLDLAIQRGWSQIEHMKVDDDLRGLHADPRWLATLNAGTQAADKRMAALKEPALARELLARRDKDQLARHKFQEAMSKLPPGQIGVPISALPPDLDLTTIDRENTDFMMKTIEKYGWPGKSLVGDEAAMAAWLLVQHADAQPEFQEICLDLLTKAVKNKDAEGQHLAYLTDRVRIKQGKMQLFGTQFRGNGKNAVPAPIEDEANVDVRRKQLGMSTMEEYTKVIRGQGS